MIENLDIRNILNYATNAPSGSNSQPWRFEILNNELKIFALPEKDHPILNYRSRGTWIAHGALLENISIVSNHFGYKENIIIHEPPFENNQIATISFIPHATIEDVLFPYIQKRATNRKKYKNEFFSEDQKSFLFKDIPSDSIAAIEDLEKRRKIGQALSLNEVVMLENRTLHKLFFDEIVWTQEEERVKKSGLYIKTMELNPLQRKMLGFFKNWKIMSLFNRIGFAKLIARDNAETYSSGSAIVAIIINDQDSDFVCAGRIMQRIWLRAISLGLSGQIISGIPFLWQRLVLGKEDSIFSISHQRLIQDSYKILKENFVVKNGIISMTLRLGWADPPSALSSRLPPDITTL